MMYFRSFAGLAEAVLALAMAHATRTRRTRRSCETGSPLNAVKALCVKGSEDADRTALEAKVLHRNSHSL